MRLPPRRRTGCLVAVVLTTSAVSVVSHAPSTASSGLVRSTAAVPADERPGAPAGPATVTLLTGDRVTVLPTDGGKPRVVVEGGASARDDMIVRRDGARVEVIPRDVAHLVPSLLDPDLFDVVGLVAMGYDDAHRASIPLIAHRAPAATDSSLLPGLRTEGSLRSIGAEVVELSKKDAAELGDELAGIARGARRSLARSATAALGFDHLWLDGRVAATAAPHTTPMTAAPAPELDPYLTQVRAPAAWEAGLDGEGVTVAVLDSGVDDGHPALTGRVDAAANFSDSPGAGDVIGHGTQVASLVVGSGAGSGGSRQGIAPAADLVSGKVLGDDGRGQESWVIAGMQWAVDQGAEIVNMSLSATAGDADDPVTRAVDALSAESGVLFVVAAGNDGTLGPSPFTISSPGTAESALTVAAVDGSDTQAGFSSEGPTRGSFRSKPDVAAPGTEIMTATAGARAGDENLYGPMSGTSAATPIVAGGAALVLQQHPKWTWHQVKSALATSADPVGEAWSVGAGRLDLVAATTTGVTAHPSTLSPGAFVHPDESPWTTTVTLTNTGTRARSYTAADAQTDSSGQSAPADALVVTPETITVAPGASTSVVVTFDASRVGDDLWQGHVELTADDGSTLRLPFGTYDEPERYTLELTVLDRSGEPYAGGDVPMQNLDTGAFYRAILDEQGHASVRLPPGRWTAFARIETPATATQPGSLTIAGTPDVDLRSDVSLVIDARTARPLRPPTVAGQPTRATEFSMVYASNSVTDQGYLELAVPTIEQINAGQVFLTPTGTAAVGNFEVASRWRLVPTGRRTPATPSAYELQLVSHRFGDPATARLRAAEVAALARVRLDYHATANRSRQTVGTISETAGTIGIVHRRPIVVPRTDVELTSAGPQARWGRCLTMPTTAVTELCSATLRTYPRGVDRTVHAGRGLHVAPFGVAHGPDYLFVEQAVSDGALVGKVDQRAVASASTTVYRNGRRIGSSPDTFGWFAVPPGGARYRVVSDYRLRSGTLPVSAHTVWTFHSAAPDDPDLGQTIPSVLTVDYGAKVDALGRASHRRNLRFALRFGTQAGAEPVRRVAEARLSWSSNGGRSWHRAKVKRTGATAFSAVVRKKLLRKGATLSLRLRATNVDGSGIEQTQYRFIRVR